MRIALVIQRMAKLKAGAQRWCIEFGEELVDRGHEVTIVTYETSSEPPAYPTSLPIVNVFPRRFRGLLSAVETDSSGYGPSPAAQAIGRGGVVGSSAWRVSHGSFGLAVAGWLSKNSPDVAVGVLAPGMTALHYATKLTRGHRPRLVASQHNAPPIELGKPGEIRYKHNISALQAMDAIHVLNNDFICELPEAARGRAVAIPNPLRRLSPPDGTVREPVILGVGRLVPVKGYDKLIDAFALIKDEVPGWTVEICGDGPEANRLAAQIVDRGLEGLVTLRGVVDQLGPLYDRASILGHPAAYEGHPLAVCEAIMHGLPVAGFADAIGVNAVVVNDSSGRLSAPGVEAFSQTLLSLIKQPIPVEEVDRGRSVLEADHKPDRIYDRLEHLLR